MINENILFVLEDDELQSDISTTDIMNHLDKVELNNYDDNIIETINYKENYTIKQLMIICEYYEISKNIKLCKCNKDDIINILVSFETDLSNQEIVFKRKNMWYFMSEIKNDKFMKKYVMLW